MIILTIIGIIKDYKFEKYKKWCANNSLCWMDEGSYEQYKEYKKLGKS